MQHVRTHTLQICGAVIPQLKSEVKQVLGEVKT